ncbi:hypothetical protein Tco_0589383 [Tanacetum coccineum]
MTTLAEYMIVVGAENRPPMLDKLMYNSWESRMLLYIKGKKNGRVMLESIKNGPLVYPIVEEMVKFDKRNMLNSLNKNNFKMTVMFKQQTLFFKVNTKFLNALQPKWSKFVTDVKLAKNMYTTNYDQLYAYLSQHEGHANEARLLRERYPDPLVLVANQKTQSHSAQYQQQLSLTPQRVHSSQSYLSSYEDFLFHHFLLGDDPIACLNKAMAFMSTVMALRFPSTNNQLRTSSNPRNQATIQDGRVIVQQVQGRQGKEVVGSGTESGQVLDEEQLAIIADPGVADGQDIQTTITHNATFQTDD